MACRGVELLFGNGWVFRWIARATVFREILRVEETLVKGATAFLKELPGFGVCVLRISAGQTLALADVPQ